MMFVELSFYEIHSLFNFEKSHTILHTYTHNSMLKTTYGFDAKRMLQVQVKGLKNRDDHRGTFWGSAHFLQRVSVLFYYHSRLSPDRVTDFSYLRNCILPQKK